MKKERILGGIFIRSSKLKARGQLTHQMTVEDWPENKRKTRQNPTFGLKNTIILLIRPALCYNLT